MARRLFTAFVPAALVGLVSAALFGGFLTHCRIEWLQMVAREIQAACRDAGTQWMVVVCLLSYLVTFLILQRRLPERGPDGANVKHSTPHPGPLHEPECRSPDRLDSNPDPQQPDPEIGAPRGSGGQGADLSSGKFLPGRGGEGVPFCRPMVNPDFWLVGLVAWVLLRYAVDYTNAAKSLQVVVLLTGLVVGKGVALWVRWPKRPPTRPADTLPMNWSADHLIGSIPILIRNQPVRRSALRVVQGFKARTCDRRILSPSDGERARVRGTLSLLLFLLAASALWQPELGMEFHYRGVRRWEGVWDNPNIYGLLMGVGLTLATGLLVSSSRLQVSGCGGAARGFLSPFTRHLSRALLFAAAGLCSFGLLKSYSRGAWLGTAVGIGVLLWHWIHCGPSEMREGDASTVAANLAGQPLSPRVGWVSRLKAQLRLNWLPGSILLLSLFVLVFWQFRDTESRLVRRVFSVGNVNDFSWRNRVAAWEGAGRMLRARPVVGFGWGQAEEAYREKYHAARLEETAAIQLNDYLMLGISAGVPALGGLVIYLALALRAAARGFRHRAPAPADHSVRGGSSGPQPTFPQSGDGGSPVEAERGTILAAIAVAGASVLLVGFWFDGALFKLPTCAVFWVLLELARASLPSRCPPAPRALARKLGEEPQRPPLSPAPIALRWLAGIAALLAIGQTTLHLGLPRFTVGPRTLALARSWLVPAREKADFDFLAAKQIWSGRPLQGLLEHSHLANYNRQLVNWQVEATLYQSFVLSPEIDPAFDGDLDWRRPLWEFFYPRIRKETSLTGAAETIARQLRERVKPVTPHGPPGTITEMWRHGRANDRGGEALAVAALRSAGIPARFDPEGRAEFWNGDEWKPVAAPPPP